MPEYDDIFALKNIRKIGSKAKVIIVTGNLQKDTSEELDYLIQDKILQKPFEVDKIVEVVNEIKNAKQTRIRSLKLRWPFKHKKNTIKHHKGLPDYLILQ